MGLIWYQSEVRVCFGDLQILSMLLFLSSLLIIIIDEHTFDCPTKNLNILLHFYLSVPL